jgi:anti-sigma B factor antagonist
MFEVSPSLHVRLITESGAAIVRPHGAIDLNTSPSLRAQLLSLAEHNPSKVIFDLSGVPHIDSSGAGTLVEFKRYLGKSGGGQVVLAGLQPPVQGVFEITKLNQFFTIVASVDEARQN